MSLRDTIGVELGVAVDREPSGVWVQRDRAAFAYSDGAATERHLRGVLRRARDLGSDSPELESAIRDWPSRYHLSRERAQLLRGLRYDGVQRVLEVGAGCGAITRYLGEQFPTVVAVEGALPRARLARLRTAGQENVDVVCAPFQAIRPQSGFDLVTCIGVLEYAPAFVGGPEPFDAMIARLGDLCGPDGTLILAIENQFGLRYFGSSPEDHSGLMFDGLEGTPRHAHRARTFGRAVLDRRLRRHFAEVRFCYPFPDYKTPMCVLTEEFLAGGGAGELVAGSRPRDPAALRPPLFDEVLVALELDDNGLLPLLANSFLVLAHRSSRARAALDGLGVMYSVDRVERFRAVTHIRVQEGGGVLVSKTPYEGAAPVVGRRVELRACSSTWQPGRSIQATLLGRCKAPGLDLAAFLEPCRAWLAALRQRTSAAEGRGMLPGDCVDAHWGNSFVVGGRCVFVDAEWAWRQPVRLEVVFIRAAVLFLTRCARMRDVHPALRAGTLRARVRRLARALDLRLRAADFGSWVELEAGLAAEAFGGSARRGRIALRLRLVSESLAASVRVPRRVRDAARGLWSRAENVLGRLG